MSAARLSGVIAAVATPIDESGAPDLKRAVEPGALSARQWLRWPQRPRHDRRSDLILARRAQGRHGRLQGQRPAIAPPDGRDWCRCGIGCSCVDAPRGRARLWRCACAPALLLQGSARRRLDCLCRHAGERDGKKADPDLSLSFPGDVGAALARGLDPSVTRRLPIPHCGSQGLFRRHGLCPLGRGDLQEFFGIPVNRSLPDRGTVRRFRGLHLGDRQSSTPIFADEPGVKATPARSMRPSRSASCSTARRWSRG